MQSDDLSEPRLLTYHLNQSTETNLQASLPRTSSTGSEDLITGRALSISLLSSAQIDSNQSVSSISSRPVDSLLPQKQRLEERMETVQADEPGNDSIPDSSDEGQAFEDDDFHNVLKSPLKAELPNTTVRVTSFGVPLDASLNMARNGTMPLPTSVIEPLEETDATMPRKRAFKPTPKISAQFGQPDVRTKSTEIASVRTTSLEQLKGVEGTGSPIVNTSLATTTNSVTVPSVPIASSSSLIISTKSSSGVSGVIDKGKKRARSSSVKGNGQSMAPSSPQIAKPSKRQKSKQVVLDSNDEEDFHVTEAKRKNDVESEGDEDFDPKHGEAQDSRWDAKAKVRARTSSRTTTKTKATKKTIDSIEEDENEGLESVQKKKTARTRSAASKKVVPSERSRTSVKAAQAKSSEFVSEEDMMDDEVLADRPSSRENNDPNQLELPKSPIKSSRSRRASKVATPVPFVDRDPVDMLSRSTNRSTRSQSARGRSSSVATANHGRGSARKAIPDQSILSTQRRTRSASCASSRRLGSVTPSESPVVSGLLKKRKTIPDSEPEEAEVEVEVIITSGRKRSRTNKAIPEESDLVDPVAELNETCKATPVVTQSRVAAGKGKAKIPAAAKKGKGRAASKKQIVGDSDEEEQMEHDDKMDLTEDQDNASVDKIAEKIELPTAVQKGKAKANVRKHAVQASGSENEVESSSGRKLAKPQNPPFNSEELEDDQEKMVDEIKGKDLELQAVALAASTSKESANPKDKKAKPSSNSSSTKSSKSKKTGLAAIIERTGIAGHRRPGLSKRSAVTSLHHSIKPPAAKPPIPKSKKRADSDDDGEIWVDPIKAAREEKLRRELGLESDEEISPEHKRKLLAGSDDEGPQYNSD